MLEWFLFILLPPHLGWEGTCSDNLVTKYLFLMNKTNDKIIKYLLLFSIFKFLLYKRNKSYAFFQSYFYAKPQYSLSVKK